MAFSMTGNWNLGKVNLPEFGLSEFFAGGNPQSTGSKSGVDYITQATTPTNVNYNRFAPLSDPRKNSSNDYGSVKGASTSSSSGTINTAVDNPGDNGSSKTIMGYSPSDYYDRLGGAYSETLGALNNTENRLRGDFNNQVKTTTDLFNSQIPQINQAKDKALNVIQDAQTASEQGSRKAVDQARNLGGQLTQRANNLFGSGALSGVGEAAQEIYGRELQRNIGSIHQNLINNITQLNNERKNVEVESNNKIQQVQVKLQQAISNLQSQLSARLSDVDSMRGEIASRRDEIKLDLMREYRTRARQLQDEARGFAQQIAVETGNATRYLDTLMGQYNEALQGASTNAFDSSRNVITDAFNRSGDYSSNIGSTSNSNPSMVLSGYRKPIDEQSF